MKKKIILILSIMVIAVCMFALTVSASNYGFELNNYLFDSSSDNVESFEFEIYSNMSHQDGCPEASLILDEYAIAVYKVNDDIVGYAFVNIEKWHLLLQNYGVVDVYSFYEAIYAIGPDGYMCNCNNNVFNYLYDYHMDDYCQVYMSYLSSINDKTYEDGITEGKELGVSEYISSEEYTNALNNRYTEGKQAGYDEGVTAGTDIGYNTGYAQGKTDGYSDGYTIGYNEYIGSKEYAKVLKAKYDDGFSDGEEEAKASSFNVIISVLPVMLILDAVAIGIVVYKVIKRRKNEIQK